LELDDTIELWLAAPPAFLAPLAPYLARLTEDTLADSLSHEEPPADVERSTLALADGEVVIALRRAGANG
jgi:hypothetical protein